MSERALEVWDSEEKIEEAKDLKCEKQNKMKKKKFEKKMKGSFLTFFSFLFISLLIIDLIKSLHKYILNGATFFVSYVMLNVCWLVKQFKSSLCYSMSKSV